MRESVRQFTENLTASGLIAQADFDGWLAETPEARAAGDPKTMALLLIRAGQLTEFQAKALLQGKTKGLVFGDYVVLDKIGAGGMGVVLKARHRRMDRVVALKVLPAKTMKSGDAVERFYREVKAAARLTHPNIVTAHDAGESGGTHYFVMEYVEGQDLAHLVKDRGPLPVAEAIGYMIQAARGLEYAHTQGIVHRDIKPANLLLDAAGTVKVLDMGLARFEHGLDEGEVDRLTHSGQAMGTCDYMAPEQAEDTHRADRRSDVYSLGCSLHRLLTGKPMYSGDTMMQILLAHRDQPIPSLCTERPDAPEQLDGVYQKMVAKRPEDRYQSMDESIAALEACLQAVPIGAGDSAIAASQPEPRSDSKLKTFFKQFSRGGETIQQQVDMETGEVLSVSMQNPTRPWWLYVGISAGVVLAVTLGIAFLLSRGAEERVAEAPAQKVPAEPDLLRQQAERIAAEMAGMEELAKPAPEPVEAADTPPANEAPAEPEMQPATPPANEDPAEPEMQPDTPAEPVVAPVPEVDPAEVARRELLEKQRAVEAKYATAMKLVEEKVAAWDFAAAWQAAEAVRFDEPDLTARLEARHDEIQRMELLKRRIIAKIGEADPPLKKIDLKIRGIGGEITDAGPAGLTTKTIRGDVERLTWDDLGNQAAGELTKLVFDPANGEDCIAAGLLALASGDRAASERFFEQAEAAGSDVSAQLAAVAASALADANELLSQDEFGKAISLLESMEANYVDLPWLAANRETIDAAVATAKKGVREGEAEALYGRAVMLREQEALFDLQDAIEQLKREYADCGPARETSRSPSLLELQESTVGLGVRLVVRQDGEGDFASIQAALDAAAPNSLIEIQDAGPYCEKLQIRRELAGLTLRGKEGIWPVVTSVGSPNGFPVLLEVKAKCTLECLILAHGNASGESQYCVLAGGPGSFRSCVLYGKDPLYNRGGHVMRFERCALIGNAYTAGQLFLRDSFWLGDIGYPWSQSTFENCVLTGRPGGCIYRSCTIGKAVKYDKGDVNGSLADCIVPSVESALASITIEHSNIHGKSPFVDLAKPGEACFGGNPQFVNPGGLDYRLMPTSPCIGKASDGGDIGVRYTPEMMEMCRIALELRAKGVIKF